MQRIAAMHWAVGDAMDDFNLRFAVEPAKKRYAAAFSA
jgi:hypothetical protein